MGILPGVTQMSDISTIVTLPEPYKTMLEKMNDHWIWHVSHYKDGINTHYALWHEEGCHHEYIWLDTELLEDMLMAIEYLYHHRIGGKQITWAPKGYWLDDGYKALANIH